MFFFYLFIYFLLFFLTLDLTRGCLSSENDSSGIVFFFYTKIQVTVSTSSFECMNKQDSTKKHHRYLSYRDVYLVLNFNTCINQ